MSLSQLPHIATYILNQLEVRINNTPCGSEKNLSDEELLSLHSVFGGAFRRSLDILEKHPTLTVYTKANKSRELIEVKGENDRCYRLFPRVNYCPCLAYKHQVIEQKVQVTCKHILAARLALILDKVVPHEVTDVQYLMLLNSMFEIDE